MGKKKRSKNSQAAGKKGKGKGRGNPLPSTSASAAADAGAVPSPLPKVPVVSSAPATGISGTAVSASTVPASALQVPAEMAKAPAPTRVPAATATPQTLGATPAQARIPAPAVAPAAASALRPAPAPSTKASTVASKTATAATPRIGAPTRAMAATAVPAAAPGLATGPPVFSQPTPRYHYTSPAFIHPPKPWPAIGTSAKEGWHIMLDIDCEDENGQPVYWAMNFRTDIQCHHAATEIQKVYDKTGEYFTRRMIETFTRGKDPTRRHQCSHGQGEGTSCQHGSFGKDDGTWDSYLGYTMQLYQGHINGTEENPKTLYLCPAVQRIYLTNLKAKEVMIGPRKQLVLDSQDANNNGNNQHTGNQMQLPTISTLTPGATRDQQQNAAGGTSPQVQVGSVLSPVIQKQQPVTNTRSNLAKSSSQKPQVQSTSDILRFEAQKLAAANPSVVHPIKSLEQKPAICQTCAATPNFQASQPWTQIPRTAQTATSKQPAQNPFATGVKNSQIAIPSITTTGVSAINPQQNQAQVPTAAPAPSITQMPPTKTPAIQNTPLPKPPTHHPSAPPSASTNLSVPRNSLVNHLTVDQSSLFRPSAQAQCDLISPLAAIRDQLVNPLQAQNQANNPQPSPASPPGIFNFTGIPTPPPRRIPGYKLTNTPSPVTLDSIAYKDILDLDFLTTFVCDRFTSFDELRSYMARALPHACDRAECVHIHGYGDNRTQGGNGGANGGHRGRELRFIEEPPNLVFERPWGWGRGAGEAWLRREKWKREGKGYYE